MPGGSVQIQDRAVAQAGFHSSRVLLDADVKIFDPITQGNEINFFKPNHTTLLPPRLPPTQGRTATANRGRREQRQKLQARRQEEPGASSSNKTLHHHHDDNITSNKAPSEDFPLPSNVRRKNKNDERSDDDIEDDNGGDIRDV